MAVSKRLRFEIFRRDGFKCRYCGLVAGETELTIDHVVPRTLGGSDDPSNLVTACKDCNAGKTSSNPDAPLVADVDQRAVEWAHAMDQAMAQRMATFAADLARTDGFDKAWVGWGDARRPAGWRSSIMQFRAFGLTDEYLAHAVDTAMGNQRIRTTDVWKYFCGICWTEIRKAQDAIRPGSAAETPVSAPAAPKAFVTEPSPNLPNGAPRGNFPVEFDALNLAERFLIEVLVHQGIGDERLNLAIDGFWSTMADSFKAFEAGPQDGPASEDDDVIEQFDMTSAYFLANIWELSGKPARPLLARWQDEDEDDADGS